MTYTFMCLFWKCFFSRVDRINSTLIPISSKSSLCRIPGIANCIHKERAAYSSFDRVLLLGFATQSGTQERIQSNSFSSFLNEMLISWSNLFPKTILFLKNCWSTFSWIIVVRYYSWARGAKQNLCIAYDFLSCILSSSSCDTLGLFQIRFLFSSFCDFHGKESVDPLSHTTLK